MGEARVRKKAKAQASLKATARARVRLGDKQVRKPWAVSRNPVGIDLAWSATLKASTPWAKAPETHNLGVVAFVSCVPNLTQK